MVEREVEVARLADIAEINPKKSEVRALPPETPVSFVPMDELSTDRPSFTGARDRPISEVLTGYTYFRDRDVLLAKITPCFENGKAGIARSLRNGVGFGSSEFYVFRCGEKVIPEYLYYLITRPAFREEGEKNMSGTGGQQRVTREFLENYEIPLPPLEEQRRIVAEIEGYQQVIDGARQILAAYRPTFDVSPDWPTVKVAEVAAFKNGINYSKESAGTGIRVFGVRHFQSHVVAPLDDLDEINPDGILSDGHVLEDGDLIFVRSNGSKELVGRCLLVQPNGQRLTHSAFTIRMRLDRSRCEPKFYAFLFRRPELRVQMMGGGANINNLSQDILKALEIPLPPLPEQRRIVAELDAEAAEVAAVRALIPRYEAKIQRVLARVWGPA